METLQKLKDIINNSSLSDEDKKFWEDNIIAPAKENSRIAESMFLYLDNFPNDIKWVTDFSRRKIEAIKKGDEKELDKILEEEEKKLSSIG